MGDAFVGFTICMLTIHAVMGGILLGAIFGEAYYEYIINH